MKKVEKRRVDCQTLTSQPERTVQASEALPLYNIVATVAAHNIPYFL